MKKRIFLALMAALLLSSTVSCGSDPTEPAVDTTAISQETLPTEDELDFDSMTFIERLSHSRTQISDDLPDADYEGYAFRVGHLYFPDEPNHMYNLDWLAEDLNGDVLNDAVYNRNLTVEERFNIDLSFIQHASAEYNTALTAPILAGDDAFDMASLHPGFYGTGTTQGYFLRLSDLDIDFSKPWWMADSIKNLSYEGQVYTAFGTGTAITLIADSPVIYFNKDLAVDLQVENLYDVVREGRWTFDYFFDLVNTAASDLNGDGAMTEVDQFGLHYPFSQQSYRYIWSFGGKYVENNTEGIPTLQLSGERMEKIFETSRTLYTTDSIYVTPDYSVKIFLNGNILFEQAALIHSTQELREADFEIGILPNCKLDDTQEHYLTNGGGGPQAIPITTSDPDRTSVLMVALNAESYKQVVPAFYETAVKRKTTSDEDSAEMLDLIFSHVVYDGCRLFNDGCTFLLQDYMKGNMGFASFAASKTASLQGGIDKTLAAFADLADN